MPTIHSSIDENNDGPLCNSLYATYKDKYLISLMYI